jgi:hypothetical protein
VAESVFLLPRVLDDGVLKRSSKTTAFGTAGVSVSAKQGRIYKVRFVNKAATAYFCQLHDKATAPLVNDVPIWEGRMASQSDVEFDFGTAGLYVANGLGLALSSTGGIVTFAGSADTFAYALFTVQT